jgi:hypothetical protein
MKVGHFHFEAAPSLLGGLILDISMGRSILDACLMKNIMDLMFDILSLVISSEDFDFLS